MPTAQVEIIKSRSSTSNKLTSKEEVEFINDFRHNLVSSIGTVATIAGGGVLFLNFVIASKRLALDTEKIADDKRLTESRLIAERFSKAIEQLGSDSIHIRLGGIYSLEKIAIDSPGDYWTIVEVLTAFVRETSPHRTEKKFRKQEVPTDTQAVLTIVARREKVPEHRLPLTPSKLNLSSTSLTGANLIDANLLGANLEHMYAEKINLIRADLRAASLNNATILDADLRGSHMEFAKLKNASLTSSDLSSANLSDAILSDANLQNVSVHLANLTRADLSNANLKDADLRWSDLYATCLDGANLHSTDLTAVKNLTEDQVRSGILCRTKLPEHITGLDPDRDCARVEGT